MWAIAFGLPAVIMEKIVSRVSSTPHERQSRWKLRLISLVGGLILAGFWMIYVFIVKGQREFSQAHIVGAGATALIAVAAVCWWAGKSEIPPRVASMLITLYTNIGVGMAFTFIAAPTDSTGLWGVGLIILTAASLGLGFVLTTMATSIFSKKSR